MRTSITLAFAAVATAVRVQHDTLEEAACRCIPSSGATVYFPTSDIADAYTLYTDEEGNENQYPWDYGTGQCAAWDEGMTGFGCEVDDAPGFCAEEWCYVSEECANEDLASGGVVDGAFYSYTSCGGDGSALSATEQAAADAAAAGEGEEEEATEEAEDEEAAEEGEGEDAAEEGEDEEATEDAAEEDACACIQSSGATVYFPTGISDAYTLYTDEEGNEIQYPWNYGVGQCSAFDEGLAGFGCDVDDAPGFCAQPWCYVSEECTNEDLDPSSVVDGAFYSYTTCGGDGEALSASEQAAADAAAAEAAAADAAAGEGEGDAAGEDDCGSDESGCGHNNVSINIDFNVDA